MNKNYIKHTPQHILNAGYDDTFDAVGVQELGFDGQNLIRQRADAIAVRYDQSGGFIGYAAVGSDPTEPVWQIASLDLTGGVTMTYADGDSAYDNIWDDRASLAYS